MKETDISQHNRLPLLADISAIASEGTRSEDDLAKTLLQDMD